MSFVHLRWRNGGGGAEPQLHSLTEPLSNGVCHPSKSIASVLILLHLYGFASRSNSRQAHTPLDRRSFAFGTDSLILNPTARYRVPLTRGVDGVDSVHLPSCLAPVSTWIICVCSLAGALAARANTAAVSPGALLPAMGGRGMRRSINSTCGRIPYRSLNLKQASS